MSLRMVPISRRVPENEPDCPGHEPEAGQDVRLKIIGEDTEVDKTIVDSIQDPIMHIVRNSMDHGIEETKKSVLPRVKGPPG